MRDRLILVPNHIPNLRTEAFRDYTFLPVHSEQALDTRPGRHIPIVKLAIYDERQFQFGSISPNSHPIGAYWAPYDPRDPKPVLLGREARFFFTPELTGCYLAISSGFPKIVMHIPAEQFTFFSQRLAQQFQNFQFSYIRPGLDYDISNNRRTVVIGIRSRLRNHWQFYLQSYVPTHFSTASYQTFATHNINYVREIEIREFELDFH